VDWQLFLFLSMPSRGTELQPFIRRNASQWEGFNLKEEGRDNIIS
jgi:hypothetical protein